MPESEIRVLALTLRDGVILCNLLNIIDPNALDMKDFNRKPQMAQFLCCQNLKLFLETCKNHYGLRESDLLEPTMLYNLTNFHRVLVTLSKLSRRVAQIHPHIPGFSTQISPSERSNSNGDIYKDLHSTLNQTLSWPFREVVATALYDFAPREPNQLPLRRGCQVLVIGKEGDSKGWWRGKTMERVGFFPKEYVREYPQPSEEL